MSKYPEMIYSWCLSRLVHFAVCLRWRHPMKKIFAQKFDYSDAYRHIAHDGKAAAQTILIFEEVAYITPVPVDGSLWKVLMESEVWNLRRNSLKTLYAVAQ